MAAKRRQGLTPYVKKSLRESRAKTKERTSELAPPEPPVFLQPGHVLFFQTPDPEGKRVELLPGDGITLRNENGHLSIAYHSGAQVHVVGRFPIGPSSTFEMLVTLGWGHAELPVNEAAASQQRRCSGCKKEGPNGTRYAHSCRTPKPDSAQAEPFVIGPPAFFSGVSCPMCGAPKKLRIDGAQGGPDESREGEETKEKVGDVGDADGHCGLYPFSMSSTQFPKISLALWICSFTDLRVPCSTFAMLRTVTCERHLSLCWRR